MNMIDDNYNMEKSCKSSLHSSSAHHPSSRGHTSAIRPRRMYGEASSRETNTRNTHERKKHASSEQRRHAPFIF